MVEKIIAKFEMVSSFYFSRSCDLQSGKLLKTLSLRNCCDLYSVHVI